ncbi:MAG: DNA recombination protein RmuC, partial [Dysgonamonadaceae bacterium]|nr:DNA recombination protein RmuC [Dysgonamonadaceae bacterium]
MVLKKPKDSRDDFLKMDTALSKLDLLMRDEFGRNREENQKSFKDNREELNNSFKDSRFELSNTLKLFEEKLNLSLKDIRETVENRLKTLQDDNNRKLEDMRKVVDEKLQETVEKRFNESFRMISERLEQVHKGLGEMQSLASGVGDLKKVLTNVKTRGNLGEIQLGSILEQILSPEQYEQNAAVKENSQERVEYVVKLPGKNYDNKPLLLPVDSKFPNEDYQRLLDAYENIAGLNPKEVELISKQFENSVK